MALFDDDITRLTGQRLLSLSRPAASLPEEDVFVPEADAAPAAVHFARAEAAGLEQRISDALEKENRRYPHPLTLPQ